jgi:molybdate transport system regulatory protein
MKELLRQPTSYRLTGFIRIIGSDERFLGPGRVELLLRIAETGSINQAAKAMGMSYKKAWEMVQSLNRQAISPLVLTQTGGEKGGGAQLSPTAQVFIEAYQALQQRFEAFLQTETERLLR